MKELHYKNYKAAVVQCPCCNKYMNDVVFVRTVNTNNWTRIVDVILAKADTVKELRTEFANIIDEYLDSNEERHKKAMSAFKEFKISMGMY